MFAPHYHLNLYKCYYNSYLHVVKYSTLFLSACMMFHYKGVSIWTFQLLLFSSMNSEILVTAHIHDYFLIHM